MTTPDPAVYRTAAQLIRDGGLTKEVFENSSGAHCTVGAVRQARYGTVYAGEDNDSEVILLAELLGWAATRPVCDCSLCAREGAFNVVTGWNDVPERTADDVATLLEQAAEKLEADR